MGVDAVYLLDEKMRIRRAIVWGVYQLIHDEATYELDAEIDAKYEAKPGEFLGFLGIDNRFLFFEIDKAETDDKRGVLVITATQAPVKELSRLIVREIRLNGADVRTAGNAALDGSGWTLGKADAGGRTGDLAKYYEPRWKALKEIALQWQARVTPRYEFNGAQVTGKSVDITTRENVYRGRLFEGASGTSQIYVARTGSPVTRLYGIGKATGTEDPPTCVTFKDVVWSKAAGDPADKPAGQDYIEDQEAIDDYGHGRESVFNDKNIEDAAQLLSATWKELQRLKKPTVSGTATAADMEHIPGHEHKIARMFDLVWVRTKRGEDVSAVIINVKRNYLHRGQTKIYIGDETDDSGLVKKIAKMSNTSTALVKTSSAQANRYIETKRLIQLNADTIQMNARLIEANADEIKVNTEKIRVNAEDIRVNAEKIALNTIYIDEVSGEVKTAYIRINAQDGLIAAKADRIELDGYVTATEFAAEIAKINNFFAGNSTVARMVVTNLNALSMTFDGLGVKWKNLSLSGTLPALTGYNVRLADGGTMLLYAFNDVSRNVSISGDGFSVLAETT